MSKTYVDTNGYLRYSDSDKLVHRHVALKKLYTKDKYPLKFGEYQVHHIDRNKLNNDSSNLIICTEDQHASFHGIHKFNKLYPQGYGGSRYRSRAKMNNLEPLARIFLATLLQWLRNQEII